MPSPRLSVRCLLSTRALEFAVAGGDGDDGVGSTEVRPSQTTSTHGTFQALMWVLGTDVPGFGRPTISGRAGGAEPAEPCAVLPHTLRAWRRALWSHWMMSCRSAVPGSAVLSPNWMMMRKGRTGQSFKPMGIDRWALGWCQVRRIFFSSLDKKSRPPFSLSLWKEKAGKQGII